MVAAACSNDEEPSSTTTTTTTTTEAEPTTTTVPGESVEYRFAEPVSDSDADQAATTMERRLESAGYAGSTTEVTADGAGLEITVAGTTSTAEAQAIVDPLTVQGELFFRHVLEVLAPQPTDPPSAYTDSALGLPEEQAQQPTDSTAPVDPAQTTTTAPPTTTTLPGSDVPSTPPDQDDANAESVLVQKDDQGGVVQRFRLAPQQLTGSAIAGAEATELSGNQAVKMEMNAGDEGIDGFNAMAQQCNPPTSACPETGPGGVGRIAIVLDSQVASAPSVRPGEGFSPFSAEGVFITAPWLTADAASVLAVVLEAGALPVALVPA
jgi:preprotein translocase subunit SecD